MDKNIIFFDSECLLCNRIAVFILEKDKHNYFYLAPLNGKTFDSLSPAKELRNLDSVVYYSNGKFFSRTKAVKEVLKAFGGHYKIVYFLLSIFPNPLCDVFYNIFAKLRYKAFGRVSRCALISNDQKSKLLD